MIAPKRLESQSLSSNRFCIFFVYYQSQRTSKLHDWFKSHSYFSYQLFFVFVLKVVGEINQLQQDCSGKNFKEHCNFGNLLSNPLDNFSAMFVADKYRLSRANVIDEHG